MRILIAACGLALLSGCAGTEDPVYFVCEGVGIPDDDPSAIEALSGFTLMIQHDQRGGYWGNASLEWPGAVLGNNYNYVTASDQILLLGQAPNHTSGRFNRVTGDLDFRAGPMSVRMTCKPTEQLV